MTGRIRVRRDGLWLRATIYAAVGLSVALWSLGRVPTAGNSVWEWAAVALGSVVAAAGLFGLRVDLFVDGDTVVVVNPFRTVRVHVGDVERVEVGFEVRHWAHVATLVREPETRVVLWALSGWPAGAFASPGTTAILAAHFAALVDVELQAK